MQLWKNVVVGTAWAVLVVTSADAQTRTSPGGVDVGKQVKMFTALSQMDYMTCHAEIEKNIALARFQQRAATDQELLGCMEDHRKARAQDYSKLRGLLRKNTEALTDLKEYYSDWIAVMETDMNGGSMTANVERLRKKATALELDVQ
jgi:hypothetical protein